MSILKQLLDKLRIDIRISIGQAILELLMKRVKYCFDEHSLDVLKSLMFFLSSQYALGCLYYFF